MDRWTELVRADWAANAGDLRVRFGLGLFRLCTELSARGPLARLLSRPLRMYYRATMHWLLGIEIPVGTRIGPGLRILHGYGIVVNPGTVLGAGVVLKHGCTLGVRAGSGPGHASPVLGDRVDLGPGAQVLGPVTIGDDAVIGAGAVVLDDVPAGGTAVGNPARVIRIDGERVAEPEPEPV